MVSEKFARHADRRRPALLPALIIASFFALSACGGDKTVFNSGATGSGGNGSDSTANVQSSRIDNLVPLNLAPGEALPGIHLRPGIEIIRVETHGPTDIVVDEEAMFVTLSGASRDAFLEIEEIWTGDILMGETFIFIIEGMHRNERDELVIDVSEFSLVDVIHGEWSIPLGPGPTTQQGVRQQGMENEGNTQTGYVGPGLSAGYNDVVKVEHRQSVTLSGGVSFPVQWDGQFDGRITVRGHGINANYECDSYTETRERFVLNPARLWRGDTYEATVGPDEAFCLDYILVKGSVGIVADFGYSIDTETTLTINPSKKFEFPHGSAFLGQTGLALYFEPYFEAGLELQLQGKTHSSLETSASFTLPLGFEYKPRDFGFAMIPNDRHPIVRTGSLTASQSNVGSGTAKIYGQLAMDLAISDAFSNQGARLTGPKAGVELGAKATLVAAQSSLDGSQADACLTAEFYAEAFGEAALVGEIKIGKWTWSANITGTASIQHRRVLDTTSQGNDYCMFDPVQPQELEVKMTWNEDTDLDLYLKTPSGSIIHYRNRNADGGTFIGDSCINGSCEGENTEVIIWERAVPPSGTYEVWAVNYNGAAASTFQIDIKTDLRTITHIDTIPGVRGARSASKEFTLGPTE